MVLSTIVYFAFSKLTSQDEREVIRTTVAEFTYEPIKKIAFINDVYVSGGFPSKDTDLTDDSNARLTLVLSILVSNSYTYLSLSK